MKIKINTDHYEEFRDYGYLIIDGVKYEQHDELSSDMDDDGCRELYVLKRETDGKFFMFDIYYVRYGYEDYGFDKHCQSNDIQEVEEHQVTITKWISVKEESND